MFIGVSYVLTQRAYNTPNNQFQAEQAVKQSNPLDHFPVSQNFVRRSQNFIGGILT